jgi:proteic killer suppression protein
MLVIKGFKSKSLKKLHAGDRSGIRGDLLEKTERVLLILDGMENTEALNLPGYRLHSLKGDLKGFCSVSIRANWRIIFRFEGGHAYDVELIDYH